MVDCLGTATGAPRARLKLGGGGLGG